MMIHSLSGGVIADNEIYTFAKVRIGDMPRWFIANLRVEAGDRVLVPTSDGTEEGTVERVENCTPQTAPIPVRRAAEILAVLPKNP